MAGETDENEAFQPEASEEGATLGAEDTELTEGEAEASPEGDEPDDGAGAEALEDAPDGTDEPGGSDDGGAQEQQQPTPGLPPGFTSWEAYAQRVQQQRDEDLQRHHQVLANLVRQAGHGQAAQQATPQEAQGFRWNPPVKYGPDIAAALSVLRDPEKAKNLPAHLRDEGERYSGYVNGVWDRWTHNPESFAEDVVGPYMGRTLGPVLHELRQGLAVLHAERFKQRHAGVLGSDENVQEYLQLQQRVPNLPPDIAIELVQARAERRARAGQRAGEKASEKDRNAQRRAARGPRVEEQPVRSRSGKPALSVAKGRRGDPRAHAAAALRALEQGGDVP